MPGVTTAHILEQVIEGYQAALRRDVDQIEDPPASVTAAMKQSVARSWKHLAREHLKNIKPSIPLGAKFWPRSSDERDDVKVLFKSAALRELAVSPRSRDDEADIEVLDAAYWMKGCSSLGKLRMAVLIAVGHGKKQELALMESRKLLSPRLLVMLNPRCQKTMLNGWSKALDIWRRCSANAWWRQSLETTPYSSANYSLRI